MQHQFQAAAAAVRHTSLPPSGCLDTHPGLPAGVSKLTAVTTIAEALRILGASRGVVAVFRKVTERTSADAWATSSLGPPMNWRKQVDLAQEVGMTPTHFRRCEAQLAQLGVLARVTADNGYRGRVTAGSIRITFGLSLAPAIANYLYFAGLVAEEVAYFEECRAARLLLRQTRQRVRILVNELSGSDRVAADLRFQAIEQRAPLDRRRAGLDALLDYRAALIALENHLLSHVAEVGSGTADGEDRPHPQTVENNDSFQQNVRRGAPAGSPPIQNTTPNSNEFCNAESASTLPPASAGDGTREMRPKGRKICLEKKDGAPHSAINARLLESLSPVRLRALASEDFSLYLEAFAEPEQAALFQLRDLGINIAAWEEALDVMGWVDAFLSLLVIDRNRFHPTNPVVCPGGTLRRFTALYRRGHLNLTRSVVGLMERDRAGVQPRGPDRRAHDA